MPTTPKPLSVAIICKNNVDTIGRTLESVRGLGLEIVAVDSGSTDGTLELLAQHGARIIEIEWMGYVETVQFAYEQCEQPWVLPLDSDESLEPELRASIEALDLQAEPTNAREPSGYRVNRKVFYQGRYFEHTWQPEWRMRLVRKERFRWHGMNPHYDLRPIDPAETVEDLTGDLRHEAFATFGQMLGKQLSHAQVMARSMHQAGKQPSVRRLAWSPVAAFWKAAVVRGGFRDGKRGWAAAGTIAAGTLMKYVLLFELTDGAGSKSDRITRDGARFAAAKSADRR